MLSAVVVMLAAATAAGAPGADAAAVAANARAAETVAGPAPVVGSAASGGAATMGKCSITSDHVRVMLLDLKATPKFASSARGLGQIVAEEAARVHGFSILSAEEVRGALDQEANKSLLGCDDNSCLAELAQALDASLVVGGRIDETPDGAPLVSLTLLNTRALVVVNRVNMAWPGEPGKLPDVVRAAAQTMLLEPSQRPPGSLKLLGVPSGARVFVDGAERTADHVAGEVGGLAVGPHEIRVDGTPTWVVVKSHETQTITVAADDGIPAVWLWLGGAGAVVAGAGTVIAVAAALGRSDVTVQAQVPSYGANDVEALGKKR